MPTKAAKRAAGRTGISVVRPLSELIMSEFVVVTSCAECAFGERTTGPGVEHTGYRRGAPQVVLHALNAVRKHVGTTGHQSAHAKIIETRSYAPKRARQP